MNLESTQEKTAGKPRLNQSGLIRSFPSVANQLTCTACGSLVHRNDHRCPYCGSSITTGNQPGIKLQETLLLFAVLLLVALNLAPVWPSDQIFGKAIFFLRGIGVLLPKTLSEAVHYRSLVSNVIDTYQSFNVVYYVTIALILFLFVIDFIRVRRGSAGFDRRVWLFLGIALLIFPLVNLIISLRMFLTPGVIGTTIASGIILFAGYIDQ